MGTRTHVEIEKFVKRIENNIIEISGEYNKAICYVTNIKNPLEIYAQMQIKALCDKEIFKDCKIILMPDCHPGKVGPIGLTMKISDDTPIMPSLIGTDIGCGMSIIKFKPKHKLTISDFQKLDIVIKENCKNANKLSYTVEDYLNELIFNNIKYLNINAAKRNIGTLGGGNHFIEISIDEENNYYLTIHSGSRSVGGDTYTYFMNEGRKLLSNDKAYEDITLIGDLNYEYLKCVDFCNTYAMLNREVMINSILKNMGWNNEWKKEQSISHNYIDIDNNIIHKGSISALDNEFVIIPINMKDGIIIGLGKGNKNWNYSAPHGSGRIYKRTDVRKHATLTMFKDSMKGIYSPSIASNTLDESPFAYRSIDLIKNSISDSVEITNILKPIYNYKNGGNE